ncbi:glycosyltransferase [Actinotalea sp. AC32]|nr:glycosyltransferase [Actinotalea sp. AC32]
MTPRASIVVPAHDEEAVIGRCLDALHRDAQPGEWEVVVTANGCTDRTVEIARAHPLAPVVVDRPEPGKPGALNAADAVATTFPRIYLDADIEVDSATLRELVTTLEEPGVLAASPRLRPVTTGCSALVRSYYRIWPDLPVLRDGYVGSGIFALSREGHARVAPFPAIVAEDDYVRRSFLPGERRTSPGSFDVHVARTARSLVHRGVRTRAGNRELTAAVPDLPTTPDGSTARYLLRRARSVRDLPHVLVFVALTVAVRVRAEIKLRRGDLRWERDESSRAPVDRPTPSA